MLAPRPDSNDPGLVEIAPRPAEEPAPRVLQGGLGAPREPAATCVSGRRLPSDGAPPSTKNEYAASDSDARLKSSEHLQTCSRHLAAVGLCRDPEFVGKVDDGRVLGDGYFEPVHPRRAIALLPIVAWLVVASAAGGVSLPLRRWLLAGTRRSSSSTPPTASASPSTASSPTRTSSGRRPQGGRWQAAPGRGRRPASRPARLSRGRGRRCDPLLPSTEAAPGRPRWSTERHSGPTYAPRAAVLDLVPVEPVQPRFRPASSGRCTRATGRPFR